MGLGVVMIVVAPKIAEIHGRGGAREDMQSLLAGAARITFVTITIGVAALVFLGRPILLIFGADFAPAYIPMLVLTLSRVVEAFAGPVGQVMAMVGLHTLVAWLLFVPVTLNIALNYILIPHFGETGAAFATLASAIVWNVVLLYMCKRKLRLDPSLLSIIRSR
jgi:O-antigen/teichoic acid export membrane protein